VHGSTKLTTLSLSKGQSTRMRLSRPLGRDKDLIIEILRSALLMAQDDTFLSRNA
jgi:hypothetical protein